MAYQVCITRGAGKVRYSILAGQKSVGFLTGSRGIRSPCLRSFLGARWGLGPNSYTSSPPQATVTLPFLVGVCYLGAVALRTVVMLLYNAQEDVTQRNPVMNESPSHFFC